MAAPLEGAALHAVSRSVGSRELEGPDAIAGAAGTSSPFLPPRRAPVCSYTVDCCVISVAAENHVGAAVAPSSFSSGPEQMMGGPSLRFPPAVQFHQRLTM